MPFSPFASRYRIWLVEDKKCLVLNEDLSFTFTGVGNKDETSKVEAPEKKKGSLSIGRHLTFELGGKKYVLDVEKDTFEVKAKELTAGNSTENDTYFELVKDVGPFEALKLGSYPSKRLAVDTGDNRLKIKELQHTKPSNITLVIYDADI